MTSAARRRLLTTFGQLAAVALVGGRVPTASAAPLATAAQQGQGELWVQNHLVTELWSGPDAGAEFFGWLRKFSYLKVMRAQGDRFLVLNPRTNNVAFVDARSVGPSGPPPPEYLDPIKELARLNVPGRLVGRADIYGEPVVDDGLWLRAAGHNTPVMVEAQVKGDGGDWYRLDSGEFVSGDQLRLPRAPATSFPGKWIDADLIDPTMVTAYDGNRAVASTLAIRGVTASQTPVGTFRISRRVANETMTSERIYPPIPRTAPGGYYLTNVLFTQYFTADGAAIHYNYWNSSWGYPGSRGCLGMNYDDSAWFWSWAEIGTPIVLHY